MSYDYMRKRILRIEQSIPKPLIVICKDATGSVVSVPASVCIKNGYDVIRTSGNNMKDAARLLDYISGPNCVID